MTTEDTDIEGPIQNAEEVPHFDTAEEALELSVTLSLASLTEEDLANLDEAASFYQESIQRIAESFGSELTAETIMCALIGNFLTEATGDVESARMLIIGIGKRLLAGDDS